MMRKFKLAALQAAYVAVGIALLAFEAARAHCGGGDRRG